MAVISDTELRRFTVDLFESCGMSRDDAAKIAATLIWADLRGVDGHGVTRIPRYVEFIDAGLMNVKSAPVLETVSPAGLKVIANRAPGPVALDFALKHLLPCARHQGVAAAVVRGTTHTGALGFYPFQAAIAGFACIALNATIPLMPYHGTTVAAIGTNPISLALPGSSAEEPLLFDMATSVVAQGRLIQARRTGTPLQQGWFVDAKGQPTTDPHAAKMTLPLGGPKGAGLSLLIECFASLLAGNSIVADALDGTGQGSGHRQNSLLIAIDVAKFIDPDTLRGEASRLVAALKALPKVGETQTIFMPGERGFATAARRRKSGIPISSTLQSELDALAARFNVRGLETAPATQTRDGS